MATKAHYATATGDDVAQQSKVQERTQDVILTVRGLTDMGGGEFRLSDVPVIEVRWDRIEGVLEEAGVATDDAQDYVEKFATLLVREALAKVFVSRVKRIG